MNGTNGQILRELFEQFQMDWFLRAFPSDPQALMARFDEFADVYATKLEDVNVPTSVPSTVDVHQLEQVAEDNPVRVEAFLQVFASSASAAMLAMVWLSQHDTQIHQIDLQFEQRQRFDLQIAVRLGRHGDLVEFCSDCIFDVAVLRHFGLLEANEEPVISGFYPLNID